VGAESLETPEECGHGCKVMLKGRKRLSKSSGGEAEMGEEKEMRHGINHPSITLLMDRSLN
jgi:hypothetical protein